VAIRVGKLSDDPEAPFRFRLGERVVSKRHDGSADKNAEGTITDGMCIYTVDTGQHRQHQPALYVVKCDNGKEFSAAETTLMLVPSPVSSR
jgi:hypothetical protein